MLPPAIHAQVRLGRAADSLFFDGDMMQPGQGPHLCIWLVMRGAGLIVPYRRVEADLGLDSIKRVGMRPCVWFRSASNKRIRLRFHEPRNGRTLWQSDRDTMLKLNQELCH